MSIAQAPRQSPPGQEEGGGEESGDEGEEAVGGPCGSAGRRGLG
jgi:hypothetical protein